ncbi:MAG: hemerythrin domain-containing protein [Kofleriaceae bacterium]
MTAATIVTDLQAQHARLRALLAHCEAALDLAETGRADAAELARAVGALRAALADHHAFEEAHLDLFGPDHDHRAHHASLGAGLDDPTVRLLAAVLRDLRDHLSHEDLLLDALRPGT